MDRLFQDYLKKHSALVEYSESLELVPFQNYDRILAVPLCGEFEDFLEISFPSFLKASGDHSSRNTSSRVLMVFVINSSSATRAEYLEKNSALLRRWKSKYEFFDSQPWMFSKDIDGFARVDLLVADFHSPGFQFQPHEGVGWARKITHDVAVFLYSKSRFCYDLIHSTDGDASLPEDYFSEFRKFRESPMPGAYVHPFTHDLNANTYPDAQLKASYWYDQYLRYFYRGLQRAGSHFAYIPIGSSLILNIKNYVEVRGFPNRLAGEDFYILSKISKTSPVIMLEQKTPLRLTPRLSHRVPFGTGAALLKWSPIMSESVCHSEIGFESPRVFDALKSVLNFLDLVGDTQRTGPLKDFLENQHTDFSADEIAAIDRAWLQVCPLEVKFAKLTQQKMPSKEELRNKLKIEMFDALSQLRFIHLLSESGCACFQKFQPWREGISKNQFCASTPIASIQS